MNVLHQMCHLPVEQTKDQRRTTFFGAVRDEAGSPRREPRNPPPSGGGGCQVGVKEDRIITKIEPTDEGIKLHTRRL